MKWAIIRGRLLALCVVALGTVALSVLAGCSGNGANQSAYPYPQGSHVTLASWYGPGFNGRRTSSGEVFRQNDLTAASKTLPLGSYARVTSLDTGKSVTVRINDRGPYVGGRGIDLSHGAAEKVGIANAGVARVKVTPVSTAGLLEPTPSVSTAPYAQPGSSRRIRARHRTYHHYRRRYTHYYNPLGALLGAIR
jgi:rare lipoprotein A (peptidoglycan hydrolase)